MKTKRKEKRDAPLNRIQLLLTDDEKAQLKRRAAAKKMRVSSYLRDRLDFPLLVPGRPKKAGAK